MKPFILFLLTMFCWIGLGLSCGMFLFFLMLRFTPWLLNPGH